MTKLTSKQIKQASKKAMKNLKLLSEIDIRALQAMADPVKTFGIPLRKRKK